MMCQKTPILKKCLIMGVSIFFGVTSVQAFSQVMSNSQQGATGVVNQTPLSLSAVQSSSVNRDISSVKTADQIDPQHLFPKANGYENQAFSSMARQAMPLTPEQIIRLKKMLSVTQQASATSATVPPKPTLSTQVVSLAPGAMPPVVRLQQGFVTSIVFVDSTGASWPITAYDLGNSRAFNIQWEKDTNTLMVQSISMYTYGNLAVKLKGLSTPVMLTLVPGQQIVDYRVDLRVQGLGPNAKPMMTNAEDTGVNSVLLSVLDGVAPHGAKVMQVSGGDCQAWLAQGKMYLRTRLTVLSPSWISVMSSPDGMRAYEMEPNSTVLVSMNGKPVELKLESE